MSSGFIPEGTAESPTGKDHDWLAAQQKIEATRRRKVEESRQPEGKSLFDTLEANKVAKQEAFEEANRLKNQFRALDEDEVEFLDSVLESTRAEEARVKKETAEGLLTFRKQQEEADRKAKVGEGVEMSNASTKADEEQWVTGSGRKRKRAKEKEVVLKGVKVRRSSTSGETEDMGPSQQNEASSAAATASSATKDQFVTPQVSQDHIMPPKDLQSTGKAAPPAKPGLSLVDYASDEND